MAPVPLGAAEEFVFWRLDQTRHAKNWESGAGARSHGGRWNARGTSVVYASLDPATALLEVAVHRGFEVLDAMPHVLTCAQISDTRSVHVLSPGDVPDPNWLRPGFPSSEQQAFGDRMLRRYPLVVIPSVVSSRSWNLLINPEASKGMYTVLEQEPFSLDPRLGSRVSR